MRLLSIRKHIKCLWFLTALSIVSCRQSSTEPAPNNNGTFGLGTPKSYQVSGTSSVHITDTISGSTFIFPKGGIGTLTITPIITVPQDAPVAGKGYQVDYSGSDSMEIAVTYQSDEVPLMYVWSIPDGSVYENRSLDASWLSLEASDTVSVPAVFPLRDPGTPASITFTGKRTPSSTQRPYDIWQSTIKKSNGQWEKLGILTELAKNCILAIYDALPASVQPAARAEIDGRLAPKVHYAYPGMISLYHPFIIGSGLLGSTTRTAHPYFMFQTMGANAASSATVAHEVGHYMSHVLLGDDNMATLESQANKYHDMGDTHSGRPMLEEYAMFADYFMWGKTSGSNNMEEPINLLNLLHNYTPAQIDWPSREGYATCLLAVLHAGKSKLSTGLSGSSEDIPVIKASFTDEWGMLANKPLNVNALRAEIGLYLTNIGRFDAAPVLLERTGWSYHGTGKIVNTTGQPIAGVKVLNVTTVASEHRDYYTGTTQATTDKDGNFSLDRICPGFSNIRIWLGNDSMDIAISVDANKPTTASVDLGSLVAGNQSDRYILDQFTLTSQSGQYDEPYDQRVIIPMLDRMVTAKKLTLSIGYYLTAGDKSMYLAADDSTEAIVGTDYASYSTDVLNLYQFSGTLTSGTVHGRMVTGAVGAQQLAMAWFESNLTLSGNTITGTIVYDGRRYVPDPNNPSSGNVVLQSEGIRTYTIHGTRAN